VVDYVLLAHGLTTFIRTGRRISSLYDGGNLNQILHAIGDTELAAAARSFEKASISEHRREQLVTAQAHLESAYKSYAKSADLSLSMKIIGKLMSSPSPDRCILQVRRNRTNNFGSSPHARRRTCGKRLACHCLERLPGVREAGTNRAPRKAHRAAGRVRLCDGFLLRVRR